VPFVSEQHSIADARRNLEELVRKAEEGEEIELTREGEAVAVLIGRREHERVNGRPRKTFAEAYDEFRRKVDLEELDIDPDEVFSDVRDPTPGRDVDL